MFKYKDYLIDAIILVVLALGLTFVSFLFVQPNIEFGILMRFIKAPVVILLNFLPIFSVLAILYCITKRFWTAFLIQTVLVIAMGITNVTKIYYRQEVFKVIDFTLFGEATKMLANDFKLHFPRSIFLVAIILFAIAFGLYRFRNKKLEGKSRLYVSVIVLVITFASFKITTNQKLYFNREYAKAQGFNKWITVESDKAHGMVYSFMHSFKELSTVEPDGYDEQYAKAMFEKYTDEPMPDDKKINIIAIMFESYNDFSKYNVDFKKYPYDSNDYVKEHSIRGSIVVDVFGGGTVHTERTFLTGNYNQPFYNRPVNSYVWYLKSQGYNTTAMHPHMGGFYNRVTANKNLGYDEFFYDENYFNNYKSEIYPRPDEDLFKHILKDYNEKKKTGKPYFNMTVTMQNHGPYPETPAPYNYIDKKELDDKTFNSINNYFDGIRQSSDAFKKLLSELKEDDEPVIVVAFGDHNPYLGENDCGFKSMGIDVSPDSVDGYLNRYRTPYIIWANDKAKSVTGLDFVGDGPTMSSEYLFTHVFNMLGLKGPRYMQIKNNEFPDVSIFNKSYMKIADKMIPTKSEEALQTSIWLNSLDYYYNTNFMYEEFK